MYQAGNTVVAESLVVLYQRWVRTSIRGGYAPELAKAEGSSIVDEPGEG